MNKANDNLLSHFLVSFIANAEKCNDFYALAMKVKILMLNR